MHALEAFLSLHPWGTVLLGVGLAFVALIAVAIAFSRDTSPHRASDPTGAPGPTLSDIKRVQEAIEAATIPVMLEPRLRDVREWQRLDQLSRKLDECATEVHELQAEARERLRRKGKSSDGPASPNEGGDSPGGPRGGAPADGADATVLFPKPATNGAASSSAGH